MSEVILNSQVLKLKRMITVAFYDLVHLIKSLSPSLKEIYMPFCRLLKGLYAHASIAHNLSISLKTR